MNYYIISLSKSDPQQYLEAAWVADQYITGNATRLEAQAAIWEIMFGTNISSGSLGFSYTDSNVGYDSGVAQHIEHLYGEASLDYGNLNLNGFYLATSPDNTIGGSFGQPDQDCIFYVQPVPEPPSLFLAGFTLLGFAMFKRRKTAIELG